MKTLHVTANGVYCLDCDQTYLDVVECPEEPVEHVTEPVHVSDAALGLDDDQDYWHWGNKRYEYTGDGIVTEVPR